MTTTSKPTVELMDSRRRTPLLIWLSLFAYLGIWVIDAGVRLPKALNVKESVFLEDMAEPYVFLMVTVFPVVLFIFRRRNWARIVYVVMACIAFGNVASDWKEETASNGVAPVLGQFALYLLSVGLLFVGKSRDWFRVDMKRCPFCNRKIRSEAVKCRYCYGWLNTDTTEHRDSDKSGIDSGPGGFGGDNRETATQRERKTDKIIYRLWILGAVLFFLCYPPTDTVTDKIGEHKLEVIDVHLLGGGRAQSSSYGTPDGMSAFTYESRRMNVKLEHEVLTVNGKRYLIPKQDDTIRIKNSRVWFNGRRAEPEPNNVE